LRPELFLIAVHSDDNRPWRVIVNEAFEILNRESTLNDIYSTVIRLAPAKVQKNKHFKEKIRQILQVHFNHVEKGVWANN
jgi:hypothetical protein